MEVEEFVTEFFNQRGAGGGREVRVRHRQEGRALDGGE